MSQTMPQLVPGVPLQLMVPVHVHVFKCVLRHSALPRWDSPQLAPGGLSARYSSHTVSMRTHEKKVLLSATGRCERLRGVLDLREHTCYARSLTGSLQARHLASLLRVSAQ